MTTVNVYEEDYELIEKRAQELDRDEEDVMEALVNYLCYVH